MDGRFRFSRNYGNRIIKKYKLWQIKYGITGQSLVTDYLEN